MAIKKIKNADTVTHTWVGQEILAGAYYTIQATQENKWANDDVLLTAIGDGLALVNDGTNDISGIANQINYLKDIQATDTNGIPLHREQVTTVGWNFQYHAIEFTTSLLDSVKNRTYNLTTRVFSNLGFSTIKFYNASGIELLTQTDINTSGVITELDWVTNYEQEIIGCHCFQAVAPASNVYLFCYGAPGIANVPFGEGGINLKHITNGAIIDIDAKSAKYMSPTLPVPGVNKFRFIFDHTAGFQHTLQIIFKLYRP